MQLTFTWFCTLLFFGCELAPDVALGHDVAPSGWSDQKIESAFHDVLAHGDLSDVAFLQSTLGLTFEVVRWEQRSEFANESVETYAAAIAIPSYIRPYGAAYTLTRKDAETTTRISLEFTFQQCQNLSSWGKDWNQAVQINDSSDPHGAADIHSETIHWPTIGTGITLNVERNSASDDAACIAELTQNEQGTISIPNPPPTDPPGPGTELLMQVIALIDNGDLRDYRTTARILRTEMSTYGKLHGRHLYDGGAIPKRLIPGTNSGGFTYQADDTGVVNTNPFIYVPRRGPRTVELSIPVDTLTNCISPESLQARLRQARIRVEKRRSRDGEPYLRTIQSANRLSIRYPGQSCIEKFQLNQETDFAPR